MRKKVIVVLGLAAFAVFMAFVADAHTIPPEKVDSQKVFWGTPNSFEKPGKVDYRAVVMATPEFASIRKKKIRSGTAKYWILISKASDHAVRLISQVGREGQYDLIAAKGYLAGLEPPIEAEDTTKLVLTKLKQGK